MNVECGNCGGNVFMAACNHFRGTGHDWVLVSICMVCRAVHWTESGCLDCKKAEPYLWTSIETQIAENDG